MPIKPELRYFYPIDWPQISHWVRFVRAKGRCQSLWPAAWRARPAPGRWPLVGRGATGLARRVGPQGTLARPGRGYAAAHDQGGASGRSPRPQSRALRSSASQRQSAVPTVSPAPRSPRAPAADPDDIAAPTGAGRPVLRPLPFPVTSRAPGRIPPGASPLCSTGSRNRRLTS